MGPANTSSLATPTKNDADRFHSIVMDVAFEHVDNRGFRIGLAMALWFTILLIWLPGVQVPSLSSINKDDITRPVKRKVLKPPPNRPLETVVTIKQRARKLPMPDRTPDQPEPVVAQDEPLEPEMVFSNDEWEIGIPDEAPNMEQEVARVGEIGVEPPVFTRKVMPEYPKAAARMKLQGYVVLEAVLRRDGSIDEIKVLRSLGGGKFGFEEEAINALKNWEFLPGKVRDRPADVRMTLKVDFILKKGDVES